MSLDGKTWKVRVAFDAIDQALVEGDDAQGPRGKTKSAAASCRKANVEISRNLLEHLDTGRPIIAPSHSIEPDAILGSIVVSLSIVREGQTLFADDTTVKLQAPGHNKTKTARIWTYVRDERPWQPQEPDSAADGAGRSPPGQSAPCVWYQFTVDRKGEHPFAHVKDYKGWVHVDGYSGFNGLFGEQKAHEVACMAHFQRKYVDIFVSQGNAIAQEAIAQEAIARIALLYAVEDKARALAPADRVALRQAEAKPVFDDLIRWLQDQLPKLSGKSTLSGAIRYALGPLKKAPPYIDNGFLKIDNKTAERAVEPIALGRKNWTFVGSEGGCKAMAIAYTLISTAKLNQVDPQAWLTWALARIADHEITRVHELLPWEFKALESNN